MEENERGFSLTDFIVKAIIVIIFILFTVWLLSLSTKKMANSVEVLTDSVFSENIEKMKEVGKSYFTTKRLPENVGDVKTLTLQKMYDEHLILEVKDKNGNACSAKNSYVSVEKLDDEYQMKVYLECGSEKEYIIVIMGCYNYCNTDICEKKEEKKEEENKVNEYEYKLTKNGRWSDYGNWSEWGKTAISGTESRQVETKTVKENYTYNKTVTNTDYKPLEVSCPNGYSLSSDKTYCYKDNSTTTYADIEKCPAMSGYKVSQDGFNCKYTKTSTSNPTCPAISGYTLVSQNGFNCNYSGTKTETTSPKCDPTYGNGTYSSISNFTCYYKASETSQNCEQVAYQVQKPIKCGTSVCGYYYDTQYKTTCTPVTKTVTTHKSAYCISGYTNVNGVCTRTVAIEKTATATCPSGTTQTSSGCTGGTTTKTSTVGCPSGYTKDGSRCSKVVTNREKVDVIKICPSGYTKTSSNCSKVTTTTVPVTETRDVKYYRSRVRELIGGSVDYKWSKSKNDKDLLNAGYVLTGKTR